jgi:hypothetical protein
MPVEPLLGSLERVEQMLALDRSMGVRTASRRAAVGGCPATLSVMPGIPSPRRACWAKRPSVDPSAGCCRGDPVEDDPEVVDVGAQQGGVVGQLLLHA